MTPFTQASLDALASELHGIEAIYYDGDRILHVKVREAAARDGYLSLDCVSLATPGLGGEGLGPQIGAVMSVLDLVESRSGVRYLCARYVNWRLFISPETVTAVTAIAATLPPGTTYRDDFTSRSDPRGRFAEIRTPGPVAAKLFGYLRGVQEGQ